VADSTIYAEHSVDETTNSDAPSPGALSDEVPENSGPSLSSGLTPSLEVSTNANIQAVNQDPPAAPINPLVTASAKEEQSLKHIPPAFQLLIGVLLKHKAKGNARPLRSTVGYELLSLANTVYEQAGVGNFKQLTALAEQERFVQMGVDSVGGGRAWISLHPDWAVAKKPTPPPAPAPSSSAQKKIPPVYQSLVDALVKYRAQGTTRPLRSIIAVDIVKKDSKVFQRAGVKKFRQFSALAEKDKIVTLGGVAGVSDWISLHPDWCK
jgi:hypothetical protein